MSYLAKYKKSDFKKLSWKEYGATLATLYKKIDRHVKKEKIRIDAVIPILRGGAIPGTYLAYRFHILRILPIQYHYRFSAGKIELRKILDVSRHVKGLPRRPTLLLVEGNHCFGLTASAAAKDLRKAFPRCKILYAADHMDYSYRNIKGVNGTFHGKLTNETRTLSKEMCRKKNIENPLSYLFPWEDIEEEWTTVQGEQFQYKDTGILHCGELKKTISS